MDIRDVINECSETTKSKGFDVSQVATQVCLIASEVAEALELITESENAMTDSVTVQLVQLMAEYEAYRKRANGYLDTSRIMEVNQEAFIEEMADIQIRLASFIGGNDLTEEFLNVLRKKMDKNKARPHRHGKGF